MSGHSEIKAPRGSGLTCKGWHQEAAMRMLMNNLDPEVAEKPQELIVYGGTGKAARNWEAYDAIIRTLRELENDETMLIQSGKPVGVFRTHEYAPRVIISNSMLVPNWANWEHFRELEERGLMMYGQMTAGSWIYIGTQGILQGTYETLAEVAKRHFGGSLKGTITLTGGLGGMGGAQPLAVTMNEGVAVIAEVERERIQRRLDTGYLDLMTENSAEGIEIALKAKENGEAKSIGILANASDLCIEFIERDITPDILTDQTSAHDELNGYVPTGMTYEDALRLRSNDPNFYTKEAALTAAQNPEKLRLPSS